MELEVVCRRCGKPFVPTHRDYIHGVWRLCPPCRAPASRRKLGASRRPLEERAA